MAASYQRGSKESSTIWTRPPPNVLGGTLRRCPLAPRLPSQVTLNAQLATVESPLRSARQQLALNEQWSGEPG